MLQTVSTAFENRRHAAHDHSTAATLAGDNCHLSLSPEQAETKPYCCRALQVIALQAAENPAMMAVVAQLQHAVLTMPWEVRIAAAQAIAKVAVRSEEPYRIHCYSILRSLAASGRATGNDPLGARPFVYSCSDHVGSSRLQMGWTCCTTRLLVSLATHTTDRHEHAGAC